MSGKKRAGGGGGGYHQGGGIKVDMAEKGVEEWVRGVVESSLGEANRIVVSYQSSNVCWSAQLMHWSPELVFTHVSPVVELVHSAFVPPGQRPSQGWSQVASAASRKSLATKRKRLEILILLSCQRFKI